MEDLNDKRLRILEDTIEYYKNKGMRCTDDNSCRYSSKTVNKEGEGCAVGRLLTPEQRYEIDGVCLHGSHSSSISDLMRNVYLPKELLSDEIYELGEDFLSELQLLHDSESNWDDRDSVSLSKDGERVADNIRDNIKYGEYTSSKRVV